MKAIPLGDASQPLLRPLNASVTVAKWGTVVDSWEKDEELEVELEYTVEE